MEMHDRRNDQFALQLGLYLMLKLRLFKTFFVREIILFY